MEKIAISSTKGGVGKSSITVLLAKYLQSKGLKVGIVDADIYGPNILRLLDFEHKQHELILKKNNLFEPVVIDDIALSSMSFVINQDGESNSLTNQAATLLFNEANPIATSVNQNRLSTKFQEVDYNSGLITPTNIDSLADGGGTRAQVQDSNYTKTGHINARYNGSRVSSPDFNIRSKVN
jgi:hypothetical protein